MAQRALTDFQHAQQLGYALPIDAELTITKRVRALGAAIGIYSLSAHDLRHSWATRAARNKTAAFGLRDAGGWNSLAMPSRYVEAAKIANEGVKPGED